MTNEPYFPCLASGPIIYPDETREGGVRTHCMEPEGHEGPHRFVRGDDIVIEVGPDSQLYRGNN